MSELKFVELDRLTLSINDEVVITIVGHEVANDYQTFMSAWEEIVNKSVAEGKFELLAAFVEAWFKGRGHSAWIDPHHDLNLIRKVLMRTATWMARRDFSENGMSVFK